MSSPSFRRNSTTKSALGQGVSNEAIPPKSDDQGSSVGPLPTFLLRDSRIDIESRASADSSAPLARTSEALESRSEVSSRNEAPPNPPSILRPSKASDAPASPSATPIGRRLSMRSGDGESTPGGRRLSMRRADQTISR